MISPSSKRNGVHLGICLVLQVIYGVFFYSKYSVIAFRIMPCCNKPNLEFFLALSQENGDAMLASQAGPLLGDMMS